MKHLKTIVVTAIISGLIGAGLVMVNQPANVTKTIFVYPRDTQGITRLGCRVLLGSTLFAKVNLDGKDYETVDGSLFTEDATKMAVEFDDKTLKMLTSTSVEVGHTEPAVLMIVSQNEEELQAVDVPDKSALHPGVGTFVLNKKTGTAVWTKSKSAFVGTKLPDTQAYFMQCL